jgi:hypothetical protein
MFEKFAITGAAVLVASILMFCVFTLLVWTPTMLMAERKCLAAGYPKTSVTVALEAYCSTLDGSVTVSVVRLK